MSQYFYQGRTNNHLTWVMVDATDFATPESAMSAAAVIKIYGKTKASSLVHFVSSGTGSMAGGEVKHVGASATGVYTVALVKADLSDASAAWYDQYTVIIAGTGAAQQVLVCEGVMAGANVSNVSAIGSDIHSLLVVANSNASDAASHAVMANSRILLVQSRLSEFDSVASSSLSDILSAVRGNSDYLSKMSDVLSNAYSAAVQGASRILLVQSRLSDFESDTVSAFVAMSALLSDTHSAATAAASRITLVQSQASDIDSALTSQFTYTSDALSDILLAGGATPSAVAEAVWSDYTSKAGASPSQVYSVLVLAASRVSDIDSALTSQFALTSDMLSDVQVAADAAASRALLVQSRLSELDSAVTSSLSDILSGVRGNSDYLSKMSDTLSNAYSAAAQGASRALLVQSRLSELDSAVTSSLSDILSSAHEANSRLQVIDDLVDTEVGAIKTKTDQLTFGTANRVDAQVFGMEANTVTATAIANDALTAAKIAAGALDAPTFTATIGSGTCAALGTTTAVICSAILPASAVDDQFKGRVIIFDRATATAALRGQATDITAWTHATLTATVTALTTAPASGDTFHLL